MPHPTPRSPFHTLIQITDSHLFSDPQGRLLNVPTTESLSAVLAHLGTNEPQVDLLLATGDITQDGSAEAHRRFLDMAARIPAPLAGLPGNHDTGDAFAQVWKERAQPVIDLGNWRLILLDTRIPDSNGGALAPSQLELLREALKSAHDRHVLVVLHHNPVPSGSAWLDTMMVSNAEALFEILDGCPAVRAMLFGHIHQAFDTVLERGGGRRIRLLATPSTSVQFTPSRETFTLDTAAPGYRRLRLYPDGTLQTEVVRVTGLALHPAAESRGY